MELPAEKSPHVGGVPGITKRVASTKVHNDPDVYMIDTPGIFLPSVSDPEVGMKLALCGSVKDSVVGEGEIADYLLFLLNSKQNFSYVEQVGLKEPTDNVDVLIDRMMDRFGQDAISSARRFIKMYREGKFGLFLLDSLSLPVCFSIHTNDSLRSFMMLLPTQHNTLIPTNKTLQTNAYNSLSTLVSPHSHWHAFSTEKH